MKIRYLLLLPVCACLQVHPAHAGYLYVHAGATVSGSGSISGGGTIVESGGTIAPGAGPGCLAMEDLSFSSGSNFSVELDGTTACSGYDQVSVTGSVTLGGATLSLGTTNDFTPAGGDTFTIIDNQGSNAVNGTFAGLAEGGVINFSGVELVISYLGGDGNDVTLMQPKYDQAITFNTLADKVTTDSGFSVSATASSGLDVSFTSETSGVCTLSDSIVTLLATGDCTLTASQSGNANYNAAPNVSRTFTVYAPLGDSDNDGLDDAVDADDDNDGIADSSDAFPKNAAASVDQDGDGYPDEWNSTCDASCQADSGLTLDPSTDVKAGDVNADGAVDLTDAVQVLQLVTGQLPSSGVDTGADVDIDGKIGLEEAVYVLRKISEDSE